MRLLVLGGTVFLGRAVVDAALARGHEVTIFHRGRTGEDAHPDVEHLHGDRLGDVSALAGRAWDATIDTSGFAAADVTNVATALETGWYGFVSSVSVYRDWPAAPAHDGAPVHDEAAPPDYGSDKARAERAAYASYERVLVSRPGLIVGPYENIGRLPFWLRAVAAGGTVLVPGRAEDERQWVDARDLAEWYVASAEAGRTGTYTTVGPPGQFTMGELVDACRAATGADATPAWTDPATVAAAGIAPWTELPVWLWDPDEETGHTWTVDSSRAIAEGLSFRPLAETVEDTWRWLREEDPPAAIPPLDPAKVAAALGGRPAES